MRYISTADTNKPWHTTRRFSRQAPLCYRWDYKRNKKFERVENRTKEDQTNTLHRQLYLSKKIVEALENNAEQSGNKLKRTLIFLGFYLHNPTTFLSISSITRRKLLLLFC